MVHLLTACRIPDLRVKIILDEGGSLPEYNLGAEANAFREEVRAWLKEHWTSERREEMHSSQNAHREYHPEFARDQLTFYVHGSHTPIFHFQSNPLVLHS